MNIFLLILASLTLMLWVYFGFSLGNYLKSKPIFRYDPYSNPEIDYPLLSVIAPACNEEESIEQAVTRLINQDYPNLEVIVVNDRSTDSTEQILANLKMKYPQLKVITITDLPPNWLGKNYAMYRAAKEAKGEWLLFTDADIMFSPGSLKKSVYYALENQLDHLTISPNFIVNGLLANAVTTLFLFAVTFVFMMHKSAGIGAFNLIKRSVYKKIGTHEVIALQPIDDLALGKLVVKKGYKQSFGYSKGFLSLKGYSNFSDATKGLEKNQFAGTNYSIIATLVSCGFVFLIHVYPFIGVLFGPLWAKVLCATSILIIFTLYQYSKKYIDTSLKYALLHPISGSWYVYAVLNSMINILRRGGLEWRGTFYCLEDLKKHTL